MADKSRRQRREDTYQRGNPSERKAAKISKRGGVNDAFCTECHDWYSSSKPGEVKRHAH